MVNNSNLFDISYGTGVFFFEIIIANPPFLDCIQIKLCSMNTLLNQ